MLQALRNVVCAIAMLATACLHRNNLGSAGGYWGKRVGEKREKRFCGVQKSLGGPFGRNQDSQMAGKMETHACNYLFHLPNLDFIEFRRRLAVAREFRFCKPLQIATVID
jgi:hypothetical protein